jgi:hypothetical protein
MWPAIASPIGPSCFDLGLEGFLVAPSRPLQAGAAKQLFSPAEGVIRCFPGPLIALAQADEEAFLADWVDGLYQKTGQLILLKWGQFHKVIIGGIGDCSTFIFSGLRSDSRAEISSEIEGIGRPGEAEIVGEFAT